MAQQNYLPAIKDGDKRVLVVDGEPVPYVRRVFRRAAENRGNLRAAGGRAKPRPRAKARETPAARPHA